MNNNLTCILTASLLAMAVTHVGARDFSPAPKANLVNARAQIAAKDWDAALEELKRVNDVGSADWNNLMGYTLRKAKTPDLAASEQYYNEALRIDPEHRGTLSYSGELYLMKGDLAMAEKRLAALDKICLLPCAEYTELKKSIARYKSDMGAGKEAPGNSGLSTDY